MILTGWILKNILKNDSIVFYAMLLELVMIISAIEFYHGCEFARGKDVSDLEDPIADWNKFKK